MLNLTSPTTRFLVLRGGCFGGAYATVAFTPGNIPVDEAQLAMQREHPDLFEGSDCETCGYDYPEFAVNGYVDWDKESVHRHSPGECGKKEGYMESERFFRAMYYSSLRGLGGGDAQGYLESLERENSNLAADAPRGDASALEAWIADLEGCYPSEDCGYDLTYSMDDVLNSPDAAVTTLYTVERGDGGATTVREHEETIYSMRRR